MPSPQQILRERGLRPNKTLGQNFLIHSESAEKIVHWAEVAPTHVVVEIGPGLGAMTDVLGKTGCRVIAIEKDRSLGLYLEESFGKAPWLRLIQRDALTVDYSALSKEEGEPLRIVSNLPYSISTPILEALLNHLSSIGGMVLLLQEEVVDRLTAEVGTADYGRLAIWLQMLCDVERGPRVSRGSFYPEPDVESRLVRIVPRKTPRVPRAEQEKFLRMVALLFQHRRKSLRNALKDAKQTDWNVDEALKISKIDGGLRPQALSIDQLLTLSRALK